MVTQEALYMSLKVLKMTIIYVAYVLWLMIINLLYYV